MNKKGRIIFIVVMSFVMAILSAQLLILRPIKETKRCTEKVNATVVDVDICWNTSYDRHNRRHTYESYKYTYQFDYNGTTVSGYDYKDTQHSIKCYDIGDEVAIRVNPDNPEDFMVEFGFFDYALMLVPIVIALIGFVMLKDLFK